MISTSLADGPVPIPISALMDNTVHLTELHGLQHRLGWFRSILYFANLKREDMRIQLRDNSSERGQ